MKAALDKLLEQQDQTSEDGAKDQSLVARLNARIDAAGMHTDKSGNGPSRTTSQTG
jgi:hypothetical protein